MSDHKHLIFDHNLSNLMNMFIQDGQDNEWDIEVIAYAARKGKKYESFRHLMRIIQRHLSSPGLLFITDRDLIGLRPRGDDILIVPRIHHKKHLVEIIKHWRQLIPPYAQNEVFRALRYRGKYGMGNHIEVVPKVEKNRRKDCSGKYCLFPTPKTLVPR